MRLGELFEGETVSVAYCYIPRRMLHAWLKTGYVNDGIPVWEPAQMLVSQIFGTKSNRDVWLGYKIGYFSHASYRP